MIRRNHFYFNWILKRGKNRHIFNLVSSAFVWLFLLITQPFGIYQNNLDLAGLSIFLLGFAGIWLITFYSVDLLGTKLRDHWFGLVVKLFVFVQLVFVVRQYLCDWQCIDGAEYLELWIAAVIMFLFVYIPYMLFGKYLYFHSLVGFNPEKEGMIKLKGEGKERLSFAPDEIAYIRSDDNYVDLYIFQNGSLSKLVFRATLKSIQEQLEDYEQFQRVHRSILINLRHADLSRSSKRSLKLAFGRETIDIPVSKSYSDKLESLIIHPK